MRFLKSILVLLLFVLLSHNALAMEFQKGNEITISNQTFREDIYLAGAVITFNSVVLGDLIAAAGDVFVSDIVTGDLLVAGGNIFVDTRVGGDARIFGGIVEISSKIDGDLVVFGGKVVLTEDAFIEGDIKINGGDVFVENKHDSKLYVNSAKLTMNSRINGDVKIKSNEINVLDNFQIVGNLNYSSERRNNLLESRTVGYTYYNQLINGDKAGFALAAAGLGYVINKISWLTLLLIFGLFVINFMPNFSFEVVSNIKKRTLLTFLVGLLVMIGIPFATFILLLTLIGIPLGIFTGALYAFIFLFVRLFSIYYIGIFFMKLLSKTNSSVSRLFPLKGRKSKSYSKTTELNDRSLCYTLGILIYGILSFIPLLSFFVSSLATLFGAGAFTIAKYESFMFWKKKDKI